MAGNPLYSPWLESNKFSPGGLIVPMLANPMARFIIYQPLPYTNYKPTVEIQIKGKALYVGNYNFTIYLSMYSIATQTFFNRLPVTFSGVITSSDINQTEYSLIATNKITTTSTLKYATGSDTFTGTFYTSSSSEDTPIGTVAVTGTIYWIQSQLAVPNLTVTPSPYVPFGSSVVTYSCSHSNPTNVSGYHIDITGTGGPWEKNISGSSGSTKDDWGYQRIGYTYTVSAYAKPKSGTNYSQSNTTSKSITICGRVYAYDINGTILPDWNGVLATSWNSSKMTYKPSGYGTVHWHINSRTGTDITNFTTDQFRSSTYQGVLRLYATAEPTTYTITFEANGGTNAPAPKTVNANSICNLKEFKCDPPSEKSFKGWATSASAVNVLDENYQVKSNVTLYAIYVDNYNIDYDLNAQPKVGSSQKFGTTPSSISSVTITAGTAYTISSTTPTMEGHTFSCWQDSSGSTYPVGGTYNKSSGTTLTAQWTAKTFTPNKGQPEPATAPQYTPSFGTWTFNSAIPLPVTLPDYDEDEWRPQEKFWKITVGNDTQYIAPGGIYNFNIAGTPSISPQWTQVTYWRGGGNLWIYVPDEEG